jgi:hypothetical protein
MEKEEAFESIAAHMKKNPIENVGIFDRIGWFFTFHRLAAASMCVLLLLSAGGGVAYAAEDAMPDDVLYPVKVNVTEPLVDTALRFHPERRAAWTQRRLERRFREAEHLSSHEGFTPDSRKFLQKRIEHRMEKMQKHLDRVPEERRMKAQEHMDAVLESHQEFLDQVEGGEMNGEELNVFKEHIRGVHNKARKRWGTGPGHGKPGFRSPINSQNIPQEVRHKREQLGLPSGGKPRPNVKGNLLQKRKQRPDHKR